MNSQNASFLDETEREEQLKIYNQPTSPLLRLDFDEKIEITSRIKSATKERFLTTGREYVAKLFGEGHTILNGLPQKVHLAPTDKLKLLTRSRERVVTTARECLTNLFGEEYNSFMRGNDLIHE